jgi:hypothetical protein
MPTKKKPTPRKKQLPSRGRPQWLRDWLKEHGLTYAQMRQVSVLIAAQRVLNRNMKKLVEAIETQQAKAATQE